MVDQGEGPRPPLTLGKKRKESQRAEKLAGQATKNWAPPPPPRSGSTTELSDDMKENLDAISPL